MTCAPVPHRSVGIVVLARADQPQPPYLVCLKQEAGRAAPGWGRNAIWSIKGYLRGRFDGAGGHLASLGMIAPGGIGVKGVGQGPVCLSAWSSIVELNLPCRSFARLAHL